MSPAQLLPPGGWETSPWADGKMEAQRREVNWPGPHSRGRNGNPGCWTLTALLPLPQSFRRWAILGSAQRDLAKVEPHPDRLFSGSKHFPQLSLLSPHEAQGQCLGPKQGNGGCEPRLCSHTGPGSLAGPVLTLGDLST